MGNNVGPAVIKSSIEDLLSAIPCTDYIIDFANITFCNAAVWQCI
jgi:hypothetical protein